MKIINMADLAGTDREVKCPRGGFTSFRALLKKDHMGFSLHKTVIPKGPPQHWHYRNHLEACYCVSGLGLLRNVEEGYQRMIRPDMVYVLDRFDDHTFQALEDTVLISIFNPPIIGSETHDANGSYEVAT